MRGLRPARRHTPSRAPAVPRSAWRPAPATEYRPARTRPSAPPRKDSTMVQFQTRSGNEVRFNTRADRSRFGLNLNPRALQAWGLFAANSAAVVTAWVSFRMGAASAVAALVALVFLAYRSVRWGMGEAAYYAVKMRQIQGSGKSPDYYEIPVPADTVNKPGSTLR